MTDTPQQKAALRQSATARKVRARFPVGQRIVHRESGMGAVVLRHVPQTNAQGGHLKVRWDNGVVANVGPINVRREGE